MMSRPIMPQPPLLRPKLVTGGANQDRSSTGVLAQSDPKMKSMEINDTESSSSFLDSPGSSSTPYTDAANCRKKAAHIKRPMNSFMVWSQQERRKIESENPSMHNAEISKQLGFRWKELNSDQRQPFIEEAKRLRKLHEQEFPFYKFKPRQKKSKESALKDKIVLGSDASPDGIQVKKRKILPPLDSEVSYDDIQKQKRKMLPKIISRKKSSTMSDANLERKLLTRKNPSEQPGTSQAQSKITDKPLIGFAAMAKKLQSKDTSSSDQSGRSKTGINEAQPNSQPFDSFSFSLFEKKCAGEIPLSKDDIGKPTAKEKSSKDKRQTFIIDKQFRDNLKGTKSTQLDAVTRDIPSSPKRATSEENVNTLSKKTGSKTSKRRTKLRIDGNLTSGSICAIASSSSKQGDCLETFDYLTDMVIRSSKNREKEIKAYARTYEILRNSQSPSDDEYDFSEGELPPLAELLGDSWSESEQKFKMP